MSHVCASSVQCNNHLDRGCSVSPQFCGWSWSRVNAVYQSTMELGIQTLTVCNKVQLMFDHFRITWYFELLHKKRISIPLILCHLMVSVVVVSCVQVYCDWRPYSAAHAHWLLHRLEADHRHYMGRPARCRGPRTGPRCRSNTGDLSRQNWKQGNFCSSTSEG